MRITIKMLQAKLAKVETEHFKARRELQNQVEHWRAKAGEQATLVADLEHQLGRALTRVADEQMKHANTRRIVQLSHDLVKARLWSLAGQQLKELVTFSLSALLTATRETEAEQLRRIEGPYEAQPEDT